MSNCHECKNLCYERLTSGMLKASCNVKGDEFSGTFQGINCIDFKNVDGEELQDT